MKIRITKDTQDIRPNRFKQLPKGLEFDCEAELGNEYIRLGLAEKCAVPVNGIIISDPSRVEESINQILENEKRKK